MKHTYNNWTTKIFEGFYESHLYNSDSTYWITKTDREEGILTDTQYYDITNWEKFTNEVAQTAVETLDTLVNCTDENIINNLKFNSLYSPKYYNYETDSLIIDMDVNFEALEKFCFDTHREAFNKYLNENFTSYDGFTSFISNNVGGFIVDYKDLIDNTREKNTMIEYYLLTLIYEDASNFEGYTTYHDSLYTDTQEIIYENISIVDDNAA